VIFAEKPIKKYPRIVKLCEFAPSERALFTQRRKEAYEALHPETKNGATGGGHNQLRQLGEAAPRFTADTAARTGQSERSVQRDATRGGNASGTAWRWAAKAVGRAPASTTTTPKTICRSRAGQYAIARHLRADHAPVRCHGRMRPHAGFPD
jgi:hypothetical protein